MSGIAGVVHWDDKPIEASEICRMMEMISHRGPDGLWCETRDRVGLGFALLAMKISDNQRHQPVWLPDASLGIVADASIYNRGDILRQLGDVSWLYCKPSDAAIILATYERWGSDCLNILDGDYAFAIWDRDRECVFAARDPFGARPFFYYCGKNRLLFGSEPKQLLVIPSIPVEPDEGTVGEFLLGRFTQLDGTFFQGIQRLKPGHCLIATPNGCHQKQWWVPDPEREIIYPNLQEYYDEFRELLKLSVAKRLQTDYPVGGQLSGGFDSPAIVVVAAEIYEQSSSKLPPFETISAVYGRLPCDESYYINAVTRHVPFSHNTFNPVDEPIPIEYLSEHVWQMDSPFGDTQPSFFCGFARKMINLGARISLDGIGGDEVAQNTYELRDLVQQRKYLKLKSDAWATSEGSISNFLGLAFTSLIQIVPSRIRQFYRQINSRNGPLPPDWVSPDFTNIMKKLRVASVQDKAHFKSITQNTIYGSLCSPVLHLGLESLEIKSCYSRFESRHPYFDRPLVEFLLAIPLEKRLSGERWRHFHRRGLADHLPPEIIGRTDQTYFDSYSIQVLLDAKADLQDLLFSSQTWASSPYIQRRKAERLYKSYSQQTANASRTSELSLWQIAYLEIWLRQLSRYGNDAAATNNH